MRQHGCLWGVLEMKLRLLYAMVSSLLSSHIIVSTCRKEIITPDEERYEIPNRADFD